MNEEVTHVYINVDNEVFTTKESLQEYARSFPGGVHRADATYLHEKSIVLFSYGRLFYTSDKVTSIYSRLAGATVGIS